jgi:hypothetical protein
MKPQGLIFLMLFFSFFSLALLVYRRRIRRSGKR